MNKERFDKIINWLENNVIPNFNMSTWNTCVVGQFHKIFPGECKPYSDSSKCPVFTDSAYSHPYAPYRISKFLDIHYMYYNELFCGYGPYRYATQSEMIGIIKNFVSRTNYLGYSE